MLKTLKTLTTLTSQEARRGIIMTNTIACTRCNTVKEVAEFYKTKTGRRRECKSCKIKDSSEYVAKNKEYVVEYKARYYSDNRVRLAEVSAKYRDENRATIRETQARYYENNKSKFMANSKYRKASKLQRTPVWAELKDIEVMYELAQFATEVSGEQYHVDHILPLQGKLVSGFHVLGNLQVLTAKANLSKNNKFDPVTINEGELS